MKIFFKILCLSLFSIIFSKDLIFMNDGVKHYGSIKDKSQIFNDIDYITLTYKNKGIRNILKSDVLYIKLTNGEVYNSLGVSIIEPDTKYYQLNTNEKLIQSAGGDLLSYRRKFYTGLFLSFTGTIVILIAENTKQQGLGAGLTLLGSLLQTLAVNDVGIAGEKLQRVDIKE